MGSRCSTELWSSACTCTIIDARMARPITRDRMSRRLLLAMVKVRFGESPANNNELLQPWCDYMRSCYVSLSVINLVGSLHSCVHATVCAWWFHGAGEPKFCWSFQSFWHFKEAVAWGTVLYDSLPTVCIFLRLDRVANTIYARVTGKRLASCAW
jgi:hypothetical protein